MSSPIGSPPLTSSPRYSPSSLSSDDSLELSFDYELDADGKLIRVSKGSSKGPNSRPPTPPKTSELPAKSPPDATARRASLSRSESLPGAGSSAAPGTDNLLAAPRQLTRTSSGPVNMVTPGLVSRVVGPAPLSGGLHGTGRKIGGAQRIRREEAERQRREIEERIRREEEEAERERARRALEEKENEQVEMRYSPPQSSRPIAALPSRQNYYSFPRVTRSLASSKKLPSVSKILEIEQSEIDADNVDNQVQHQYYRRNVMDPDADLHSYLPTSRSLLPHDVPLPPSRPNSTYGFPSKARRVTAEERLRQEQEIADEVAELEARQSPSPPHAFVQNDVSQPQNRRIHQRRDSDTLRSGMPFPQYAKRDEMGVDQLQRQSPTSRSLGGTTAVQSNGRTHRSPTAPDKPSSMASADHGEQNANVNGKSTALGTSQRGQQQQKQPGADLKQRNFVVNRKPYARLDMIGKGGSSRVYRVMNSTNEIYAIKRVPLDKAEDETIQGYTNEIALLRRLEGNRRIIRLIDNEIKGSGEGTKGHLLMVMECGEVDLARLLQDQQKEPMNMVWIAYYWQQILEAVQIIHDEKIVHSDLKPANFVLVKGQLKLIDFGIAKAIANDTTNIQRDHQIGTVNYMSPEAIEVPDGMRRLKVGRPSDVWSLGCILYQMVYGYPPFHHLTVYQKMKAIPEKTHIIDFPEFSVPSIPRNPSDGTPSPPKRLTHLSRVVRRDVIRTMQTCLERDAKERATIPELLRDGWLSMQETTPTPSPAPQVPVLREDETIINPHYMRQLLQHCYNMAKRGSDLSDEDEVREAERLVQELKSISGQ